MSLVEPTASSLPQSGKAGPGPTARNILLIGMMGSGKTSIGRPLAASIGFEFVDTDALIVEAAGMSIPEIFAAEGEDGFRRRETAALHGLADVRHHVISTGGGIVVAPDNRPLLDNPDPLGTLTRLSSQRSPLYEDASHLTIDTTALSLEETVHGIVESAQYFFSRQPPDSTPRP